nr:uncharacterized protein LOC113828023 [Penaeus vannamei]
MAKKMQKEEEEEEAPKPSPPPAGTSSPPSETASYSRDQGSIRMITTRASWAKCSGQRLRLTSFPTVASAVKNFLKVSLRFRHSESRGPLWGIRTTVNIRRASRCDSRVRKRAGIPNTRTGSFAERSHLSVVFGVMELVSDTLLAMYKSKGLSRVLFVFEVLLFSVWW